jgi:Tfp pilus assembly protein PilF
MKFGHFPWHWAALLFTAVHAAAAGQVTETPMPPSAASWPTKAAAKTPIPSANSVSVAAVNRAPDGRWMVTFEYGYTGEPANALLHVTHRAQSPSGGDPSNSHVVHMMAIPGTYRHTAEITNPTRLSAWTTEAVNIRLALVDGRVLAQASRKVLIQWPTPAVAEVEDALAKGGAQVIVQRAVDLIDRGTREAVIEARDLLQALIERRPRVAEAYIELARVAVRLNWSASGLAEAQQHLDSALQIQPGSINAKILQAYVYSHQGQYKQAEALFTEAAATNPPNLWLWTNWGNLLAMQGKREAAIKKYREAITRPPTGDTYDRARVFAYSHLIPLLRNDTAAVAALLEQRAKEYPQEGCYVIEHAHFLALELGKPEAAQALLGSASPRCSDDYRKLVNGLARYMLWGRSTDASRGDLLRQARVFQPAGPKLFSELARSDHGMQVARQLVAAGDKVTLQDSQQLDALAYALRDREVAAAARLLQLGASAHAESGAEKMPVAFIPVLHGDLDGVRLMRRAGVDYAKLRYRGLTAMDVAKQQDNRKMLEALGSTTGKL